MSALPLDEFAALGPDVAPVAASANAERPAWKDLGAVRMHILEDATELAKAVGAFDDGEVPEMALKAEIIEPAPRLGDVVILNGRDDDDPDAALRLVFAVAALGDEATGAAPRNPALQELAPGQALLVQVGRYIEQPEQPSEA